MSMSYILTHKIAVIVITNTNYQLIAVSLLLERVSAVLQSYLIILCYHNYSFFPHLIIQYKRILQIFLFDRITIQFTAKTLVQQICSCV